MVIDVLAQDLDLGVVEILVGAHGADLRDEILRRSVFDLGFVQEIRLDAGARAAVEKISCSAVAWAVAWVQISSASA